MSLRHPVCGKCVNKDLFVCIQNEVSFDSSFFIYTQIGLLKNELFMFYSSFLCVHVYIESTHTGFLFAFRLHLPPCLQHKRLKRDLRLDKKRPISIEKCTIKQ